MKKKLVSVLLCATMLAVTLAGCGNKPADDGGNSDVEKEESGDDADADADADASSDAELVYWSMWNSTEPQAQSLQASIDKFTEETGIKVTVEFKGRDGQREGLQAALDAGTTIDIFDEDIDRVNTAWGDYLLDLEDYVAESDYESHANAGLLSAARAHHEDGHIRTIPYQPNVMAFFYSQDIFDEAGITEVPETWDEFLDVCQKIKDAGYAPITDDDAYIVEMFGYHMSRLVGEDETERIVTECDWDDPAVLKTAQAYEELASKGYFVDTIEGNVYPAGQNMFGQGTVAMELVASWIQNELVPQTGEGFNWGCFSYPAVDGGVDGTEAANLGSQCFGINKDTQYPDEAFQLVEYLTTGEADADLAEQSLGIPADSRNTEWPDIQACVAPVFNSITTCYSWGAGAEANADMTPILKENMLKLCGGSIDAQGFVDALKAASK